MFKVFWNSDYKKEYQRDVYRTIFNFAACNLDSDCQAETPFCNDEGICKECKVDNDCQAESPFCNDEGVCKDASMLKLIKQHLFIGIRYLEMIQKFLQS